MDVGVANPTKVGASMEIKFCMDILFFCLDSDYFDFIAFKIMSHDFMLSFKLSHRSRVVPRQAWVFSDQSTSGLTTDWWATKRSIHQ